MDTLPMKMFGKFLSVMLMGFFLIIAWLPYNNYFLETVKKKFQDSFDTFFECHSSFGIKSIHLFSLSMRVDNVMVKSPEKDAWQWKAQEIEITTHMPLLLKKILALDITTHNIIAHSALQNGSIRIMDHVQKMLAETADMPVCVKNLYMKNTQLIISGQDSALSLSMDHHIQFLDQNIHCKGLISQGSCMYKNMYGLDAMRLAYTIKKTPQDTTLDVQGTCRLLAAPYIQNCFLHITSQKNIHTVMLKSVDNSFDIEITHDQKSWHATSHLCLDLLKQITGVAIKGSFHGTLKGTTQSSDTATMHGEIHDFSIDALDIKKILFDVTLKKNVVTGTVRIFPHDAEYIEARIKYDMQSKKLSWKMTNPTPLSMPGKIVLDADACLVKGSIVLSHTMPLASTGALKRYGSIGIKGDAKTLRAEYTDMHNQKIHLAKIILGNNTCNIIFELHPLEKLYAYATKKILRAQGTGTLTIEKDKATLEIKDGNLQLPGIFNILQGASTQIRYNKEQQKLELHDTLLTFNQGTVASKKGSITLHKDCTYSCHIPCIINKFFLNHQKLFYVLFSGLCVVEKHPTREPSIQGVCWINEGSCTQVGIFDTFNTLSRQTSSWQYNQLPPISCNLLLTTHQPFYVTTPFFEGSLVLNLKCDKNYLYNPRIGGSIRILNGKIFFPYKPIYITRAKLFFLPSQPQNPFIDIIAHGRIKKYNVTIQITGTIQHPHINCSSIPHLQQEQIITLLLSGSDSGSFTFTIPSLMMHTIQNSIMKRKRSSKESALLNYIQGFLEPFKNIRIVPSFSDQTGRGGFRGAIEMNISERLRAVIQKNFSLTEDTKLEVEYAFSDDLALRAIRDERGDLGAEIEMRVKF